MISKNQMKYVRQLEQKKFRRREGAFVAEGPKVVGDLLKAGFKARLLIATDAWKGNAALDEGEGVELLRVSDEELRKVSLLQHPQQVLAVFALPVWARHDDNSEKEASRSADTRATALAASPLSLALDGVQDPGNLGTIIRIADWFGITTIFCSEDTADAWNPKVVQATMGSIARVRVVYTELESLLREARVPVYGTLLDGENLYEQTLTPEGIIVMGNEGNGISERIRPLVTHRLLIPSFHRLQQKGDTALAQHTSDTGPESLNVAIATAITCSEFRRQGL